MANHPSSDLTWNLSPLLQSDDDPAVEQERKTIETATSAFVNKWKNREDHLNDPFIMRKALDEYNEWLTKYAGGGNAGYYFSLRQSQDQNDPKLKAAGRKTDDFVVRIENDMQFFTLRIAKIPESKQKVFLDCEALGEYRHFLSRLFLEAKHTLTEPEERILNLKQSTSYSDWVQMTSAFLAKEKRMVRGEDGASVDASFAQIQSLINSQKQQTRDSAAAALNDVLAKQLDVAETELNAVLANKKTDDELRGFARPDAGRHLSDDIESDVVDVLVEAVTSRFDLAKRYYALKAKLLGKELLAYHERNVEIGHVEKSYSWQESVALVYKVFSQLDHEFSTVFKGFVNNGQIDVYPRQGKRHGAFCSHYLITQPTYLLLNHTDKLQDVLTIAHECGHGINNELVRKHQKAIYFGTPLSTAEVASTFMEDFVLQELLKHADDEEKLAILMSKLNGDISTVFRQVSCYRFEQDLHATYREKGYVPKEEIGQLFVKHMQAYMGEAVEQSPGSENWWVYWHHIRTYFYVYSYASGLLISKAMQTGVRADPRFVDKVKGFLSAGKSESPSSVFAKMGIDIKDKAFWLQGIAEIELLLNETEALAKKLGKI